MKFGNAQAQPSQLRLYVMAKISGLDGHLVEKSSKYQWLTLVLGTERLFDHNLHTYSQRPS